MSSTFDSDFFPGAWGLLAAVHGETGTVTITPLAGGGPYTVSAIFQRGRVIDTTGEQDERKYEQMGVLLIQKDAIPNYTPIYGDAVAIGSENFLVHSYGERFPILEIQIVTKDA